MISGDLCSINRSELLNFEEIRYFIKESMFGELNYYCLGRDGEMYERLFPNPQSHYLFIDVETTALIPIKSNKRKEELHLVQVAMLFYDKDFNKIAEKNIIVAPDNYYIPKASTMVHGISNEYAKSCGESREKVMEYLKSVFDTVKVIIGHNLDFDLSVIEKELIKELFKNGTPSYHFPYYTYGEYPNDRFYKAENLIDTMKLGADVCKMPPTIKGEQYKLPTLNELYRKLFGISFYGQHNAINDVKAIYECYCKMTNRKI